MAVRHLPEESIAVRVTVALAVLVAVATVAVYPEFTAQAAVAAGAIVLGSWLSHHRRRARNTALKVLITLLVLVAARDFFITLLASPYDPRIPLVRLFLWLQALHSFDLPARRDLKFSLVSAVLLMAVAAVFAQDITFGVMLLGFALAASCALVAMAHRPAVSLSPSGIVRLGLPLGLSALLIGGLIFVAIPRRAGLYVQWMPISPRLAIALRLYNRIVNPAYPGAGSDPEQTAPRFNPQGYIGFSTYVDLRLRGIPDDTVVLRVRATRPALWRGLAFDEYTGRGWRMTDDAVQEYTSDTARILPQYGPDERWPAASDTVVQTFYVERSQPNVFFGAYRPVEVFVPTGTLAVDRYAGLRSPVPLEPGIIYSVISQTPTVPPPIRHQRRAGTRRGAVSERYLQLPRMPARVRDFAMTITSRDATPYENALAVITHLQKDYRYSLQAPPLPPGADAVDYFLFESRAGSCEAFASATVVLLRAAGIPARLVTGYNTGAYNFLTGYYEVRNSDAHAWVEVNIPGAGWIEFEPTPGFAVPEAGARTQRWLAGDGIAWLMRSIAEWRARLAGVLAAQRALWPPLVSVSVVFGGVLAVVMAAVLTRRRRRSTARPGAAPRPMGVLYAQMLQALARSGITRAPEVTPREFVGTLPPGIRQNAMAVTTLFEEERYGGRLIPSTRTEQAALAVAELRRVGQRRHLLVPGSRFAVRGS